MPWTDTDPVLPFSGSIQLSRHCSYQGAKAAEPRAGTQAWRLFALYRERGAQTDHQAVDALSLPLATICARRGFLVQQGLVVACGTQPGPCGTANTRWMLVGKA